MSLDAAKVPATYANKDLDFICTVLQQVLGTQLPAHEDIKEIFKALAHGPFLTPISSISPHFSQRPIVPSHIKTLTAHLLGEDMRKDYPAFLFGLVKWMYGENLLWVTLILPDIILNILPPPFWSLSILKDNLNDRALLALNEDQAAITWITYISQVYQHLLYPGGQYRAPPLNDPSLKNFINESRKNYMGGNFAKISGIYSLWHPKVLPLFGQAIAATFGKNFIKMSMLTGLANSNIWPMCTCLEAGLAQLQPFAELPWRQDLSMVHPSTKETVSLSPKSTYAFNLEMLKKKAQNGFVFSWLLSSTSIKDARTQTQHILKSLEDAQPESLPPHLVHVLMWIRTTWILCSLGMRIINAGSHFPSDSCILWMRINGCFGLGFFSLNSTKNFKDRFQQFTNLMQPPECPSLVQLPFG
ncbi:hypothetical protein BN946_scf184313.g1 [Trametes cinnabarina]|uniref:Uncharacterized protein n=1 Tax=Pycnoporus cinnabarinus TaxID=5643 RepID=A0A060SJK6_PYCCI|nr:hypothetical protein BN946_scf184313.g1 [Trametes cinnabarina]